MNEEQEERGQCSHCDEFFNDAGYCQRCEDFELERGRFAVEPQEDSED